MDLPDSRSPQPGWFRQCTGRVWTFWLAKLLGTTLGMTAFFAAYFWILRHPRVSPLIMPLTALDRWIEFRPVALVFYLSLWVYVSLAPALLNNRRELLRCGIEAAVLAGIGLGIFLFWPTAVPAPDVDWSLYPAFAFLKTVDASGNACPSLHVAFAVFAAVWVSRALRQTNAGLIPRAFNWLWCLGIMYSTVATRQHVALDVFAGAALGGAVVLAPWWSPKSG